MRLKFIDVFADGGRGEAHFSRGGRKASLIDHTAEHFKGGEIVHYSPPLVNSIDPEYSIIN